MPLRARGFVTHLSRVRHNLPRFCFPAIATKEPQQMKIRRQPMPADLLQRQRFELKYRLPPRYVPALREFVRCHLEPDPFSAAQPDRSYPVHSIYLDSPDLRLCQATVNGERNRFKLRIRYYSDEPEAPVFFEIKSRRNDCILKKRAFVRRAGAPALLGRRARHSGSPDHRRRTATGRLKFIHRDRAEPRGESAGVCRLPARGMDEPQSQQSAGYLRPRGRLRTLRDRGIRGGPPWGDASLP